MAAWIFTNLYQKTKEKRKEGILRPLGDGKKGLVRLYFIYSSSSSSSLYYISFTLLCFVL
jgi:hypothetical protein